MVYLVQQPYVTEKAPVQRGKSLDGSLVINVSKSQDENPPVLTSSHIPLLAHLLVPQARLSEDRRL